MVKAATKTWFKYNTQDLIPGFRAVAMGWGGVGWGTSPPGICAAPPQITLSPPPPTPLPPVSQFWETSRVTWGWSSEPCPHSPYICWSFKALVNARGEHGGKQSHLGMKEQPSSPCCFPSQEKFLATELPDFLFCGTLFLHPKQQIMICTCPPKLELETVFIFWFPNLVWQASTNQMSQQTVACHGNKDHMRGENMERRQRGCFHTR